MARAIFRFYEELNDFLPAQKRKVDIPVEFKAGEYVKDIIERIGVPHTEVDLILVNGQSVDFQHRIENDDQISVYPVFETLDISNAVKLRPSPLRTIQFIADAHLGKLAKYLRMLGFNTLFDNHYPDEQIVQISLEQHRIILTRDRGLLKNPSVTHGYWLRSDDLEMQLKEVIMHFQLESSFLPFTVCLECNGAILPVQIESVKAQLPSENGDFINLSQCQDCKKVYWEGSHYQRMRNRIDKLLK